MKRLMIVLLLLVTFTACEPAERGKYLLILQAGTESHEGVARALHALLYSQELHDAGYEVTLVFDGAGTTWAQAMRDPENKLHKTYMKLREAGVTQVICDFCASAFQVREALQAGKVPLVGEYQGHPSIVKWVKQGYQLVIL